MWIAANLFTIMLLIVGVVDKLSCIYTCHCKTFNKHNNTNKHKAKSPEGFISESEYFSVSCSDGMEGENVMRDFVFTPFN